MSERVNTLLDETAVALQVIAATGVVSPAVGGSAVLLAKLLRVIKAGVAAHEAVTGVPLDLSLLHRIAPLPEEEGGV